MIVCLALSPSVDVTYDVTDFRIGAITRPSAVHRVAGGKALNVARAVHRLGAPVRAIAPLGGGTGAWIADQLSSEGVPLLMVPSRAETRSCISIVDSAANSAHSTDIYEPTPPLTSAEWLELAARLSEATSASGTGTDWVVLSGSLPPTLAPGAVAAELAACRSRGWQVAIDLAGEPLRVLLAAGVDLVKVNADEARALFGLDVRTPAALAQRLHTDFGSLAIVTDGVRGAALHDTGGAAKAARSPRRGSYPGGSGDSFLAGIVSVLAEGGSPRAALSRAIVVATANALVPGPARFDPRDLDLLEAELIPVEPSTTAVPPPPHSERHPNGTQPR